MADYGFGDPNAAMATNPYLQPQQAPDWRQVLGNALLGVGAGISNADASGRGWGQGIGPGLLMGNQMMAQQRQHAEQEQMKRWQMGMMAQEYQDKHQDRILKRQAFDAAANEFAPGGGSASPPGMGYRPPPAQMGPGRDAFVQTMMPHALKVSEQTGLDPRLVIAQAALETGYGSAAPGNNYFGIKSHGRAGGQVLPTNEAGPGGEQYTLNQSFRTYADPGESAKDYAEFLKTNGRYAPVLQAQGLDAQIDAMGKSGYATDPNYGAKLRQIAQGIPGGPQVAQSGGPRVVPQGDAIAGQGDAPLQPVQYALPPPQATRSAPPASDAPPQLTLPPKPELPAADAVRIRRALMNQTMTPEQARAEKNRIENDLWGTQKDEARTRYQVESEMWRNERSVKAEQSRHERDLKEKQEARGDTRTLEEQKRGDQRSKLLIDDENKLRDDFDKSPAVKSYRTVVPMLESAKDAVSRPTRAADLNLTYAFAKLMDPESVVRESETGMVTATGTVSDRLQGLIGQLNGGQMLQPDTRTKLIAELESRFKSIEASYLGHEEAYKGIAERRGLDFDNIRIPIRGSKGNPQDDHARYAPTREEFTGTKKSEPIRIDLSGRKPK